MPIIIPNNVVGSTAFHSSYTNSQVQLEQASENENQVQSRVRSSGGGEQQIQSQANAAKEGQLQSLHNAGALIGLNTDVCDLNVMPFRSVTGSGSSGVQSTGAIEAQAQGPGVNEQAKLANASMTATAPFTINSSAVAGGTTPFALNASSTSSAQNSRASEILRRVQERLSRKGFTQAQIQGSLASSGQAVRSAAVKQNGTVTWNPTGPFDPVTGIAPGTAQYVVTSNVANNQGIQFNSGGNSKVQLQNNSKNAGLQTNNSLALATQAGMQGSFASLIGIG